METESSTKFRTRVYIVSIINLVLHTFEVALDAFTLILWQLQIGGSVLQQIDPYWNVSDASNFVLQDRIIIGIMVAFGALHLWVGYLLFVAAKTETEVSTSLAYCKKYRRVTVILVVLRIIAAVMSEVTIARVVSVVLTAIDIAIVYVVGGFMREIYFSDGGAYSVQVL